MPRVRPPHGRRHEPSFREAVRSRFEDPGRSSALGECSVVLSPGDLSRSGSVRWGYALLAGDSGGDRVRLAWVGDSIVRCEFEDVAGGGFLGMRPEGEDSPDDAGAQRWIDRWQGRSDGSTPALSVSVGGTPFQRRVWTALLGVRRGAVTSYGRLAESIGAPGSARAVGAACGANPVALIIPCHRVVRESGELNGYRWGLDRKRALLAGELGLELRSAPG
jgi:AraC family transcriptional regulator of adaptative response/methylated-DNA-[protein]-cysteine methyltransferase